MHCKVVSDCVPYIQKYNVHSDLFVWSIFEEREKDKMFFLSETNKVNRWVEESQSTT